jgi:hypothetical protein
MFNTYAWHFHSLRNAAGQALAGIVLSLGRFGQLLITISGGQYGFLQKH